VTHAIELQDIRKTFGPKVAVEGLDLTIPRGPVVGLIGPNGAGKTTTIRMVMSILFPDSGRLSVLGRASAVESKDRIGYLPEERGLYKKMKVGQFLEYMARLKGVDGAGLSRRVTGWLERIGLADCTKKRCEELSKGMQQKVQFIAAIIHEPELIILDEPFSGLDPVNARLLMSMVDERHAKGSTIIFSTHQMTQAEALCDRIVMIHQGRKVLDDTPEAIRSRFDTRTVAFQPVGPLARGALADIREIERVETGNGLVKAVVREGVQPQAVVTRIAVAVPCHRIEVVRPTLEDVFVDIVVGGDAAAREQMREALHQPPAGADRKDGPSAGESNVTGGGGD
jgi:ABC-2 type transport system ATP-binding protein